MARWAIVFCVLGMAGAALAQHKPGTMQEARKLTQEEKNRMFEQMKQGASQPATQPTTAPATQPAGAPGAAQPAGGLMVRVKLETSLGDILLELNGEKAPISTKNFVDYVNAKFYDGLIFHRVMSNFMIQGGGYDPDMKEKKDGLRPPIKNEWQNGLKNVRGSIAMARTQIPDSATAQFYINVVDNDALDQPRGGAAYAVFGRVVEGMDVVDKIRNTPVTENPKLPMGKVVPATPVVIKHATIVGGASAAAEATKPQATASPDQELDAFLAKKEAELGKKFETSPTGLKWIVLKEGAGASPKLTDNIKIIYVGTLLNGAEFDSSIKTGKPATYPLSIMIDGWKEGVGAMKVGEKRLLVIPAKLAYGPESKPSRPGFSGIPANSVLVFEVELLDINPKE